MAKLKDILKIIDNQIKSNEFSSLISASNPWEADVTEEGFDEIKGQIEGLMTLEAAVNNKEVFEKVKQDLYPVHEKTIKTKVEKDLMKLAQKLGVTDEYKSQATVEDKINFLNEAIKENDGGDSKEVLASYKKDIEKLNDQLSAKDQEYQSQIEELKNGFNTERLKNAFVNKFSTYKLAEPYQKEAIKKSIIESSFQKVLEQATLKLSDNGEIQVFQKEHPEKELYGKNNKKMGLDDLLSPTVQDYVQVSEPSKPANPQPTPNSSEFKPGSMADEFARSREQYLSSQAR